MTQLNKVFDHLLEHGSITPLEAYEAYGIMRLSAIIFRLRNAGVPISTVTETANNKYGEPTSYARYYLEGK